MPGPRARVGIPQNRFKPPSNGLFHIIIVDNYDDIPDDLVVKVILARNTLHLVAALLSTWPMAR